MVMDLCCSSASCSCDASNARSCAVMTGASGARPTRRATVAGERSDRSCDLALRELSLTLSISRSGVDSVGLGVVIALGRGGLPCLSLGSLLIPPDLDLKITPVMITKTGRQMLTFFLKKNRFKNQPGRLHFDLF